MWFPAAGAVWEGCGTFRRGRALVEKVGHWVGLEVLGFQFLGHFVPPVRWCSVMNWSSALVPCFLHCGGHHPPGAGDHNKPFLLKLYLSRYLTRRRKIRHFPKKLSPGPRDFAHEICFKTLPDLEGKRHFLTHSLMLVLLPLNPSPVSFMSTHDPQHVISKLNPRHVLKPTHRTKWHLS